MRNRFDKQLAQLNRELVNMGSLCESVIASAAKALMDTDIDLARQTIATDQLIDEKEREIESLCLKLLLQQQPVARDLRQISAALKMITDMERIGDQAADIAEIITMGGAQGTNGVHHIGDMAKATIKMVTESVEAFVQQDTGLAEQVIAYDDVVDGLFARVKNEIIEMIGQKPEEGELALDLLMIAKYFERIGDHAVNVAEWVLFSITGNHDPEVELRQS